MTDSTIKTKAQTSVEKTLSAGQHVAQGDMNVTRANLREAHEVMVKEEDRVARKVGRRPLFRNLNISGVS